MEFRRAAIRYWERRRIVYNLALLPPAFTGYMLAAGVSAGVGDHPRLGLGVVGLLFILSAIGANVCISFGYALEFLFGSDAPDSRWSSWWRPMFMFLGTVFAMVLALFGGRNIACIEYSFR